MSPQPITESEVVILPKLSKFELDRKRYGMSSDELIAWYRQGHTDPGPILASHRTQQGILRELRHLLPGAVWFEDFYDLLVNNGHPGALPELNTRLEAALTQWSTEVGAGEDWQERLRYWLSKPPKFVSIDTWTQIVTRIRNAKLLISAGGDNQFTAISKVATNQLVIGLNTDPTRSDGALVTFTIEKFKELWPALAKGNCKVREWSRLQAVLNGKLLPQYALSEIMVSESRRRSMTRQVVTVSGRDVTPITDAQKSSGFLVYTGSGSTGWAKNAWPNLNRASGFIDQIFGNRVTRHPFRREKVIARYIATESAEGRLKSNRLKVGMLPPGMNVTIVSQNDEEGEVSLDGDPLFTYVFPEGAQVEIKLSEFPLRVVVG